MRYSDTRARAITEFKGGVSFEDDAASHHNRRGAAAEIRHSLRANREIAYKRRKKREEKRVFEVAKCNCRGRGIKEEGMKGTLHTESTRDQHDGVRSDDNIARHVQIHI